MYRIKITFKRKPLRLKSEYQNVVESGVNEGMFCFAYAQNGLVHIVRVPMDNVLLVQEFRVPQPAPQQPQMPQMPQMPSAPPAAVN